MKYSKIIQFESGIAFQKSKYDNPVSCSNDLYAVSSFLKTPNVYWHTDLSHIINDNFNTSLNYVYKRKWI